MSARPQLHIVNTETGELLPDDRDILIEQLQAELKGKALAIGKLKREIRDLRAVEPEAEEVRQVLEYWRERCAPRAVIAPGGKRWEKVRARMKDKLDDRDPWTPEELKLAVDGALLDPWLNGTAKGSKGYLDAETIFRDAEMVEKLWNLALGFEIKAGIHLGDLLEVAQELRWIDWRHLLTRCMCGHCRIEHVPGLEMCRLPGCDCEAFGIDALDESNLRMDARLRRLIYGEAVDGRTAA